MGKRWYIYETGSSEVAEALKNICMIMTSILNVLEWGVAGTLIS